ncbi:MAG TPA: hypothetical protein VIM11_05770 [Tepidisphaeraceae bacterium]|jgi:hypothetical protein
MRVFLIVLTVIAFGSFAHGQDATDEATARLRERIEQRRQEAATQPTKVSNRKADLATASDAKTDFERKLDKIEEDAQSKRETARKEYLASLKKAQDDATKRADLDEALRIRDEIGLVRDEARFALKQRQPLAIRLIGTSWSWMGTSNHLRFNADGTLEQAIGKLAGRWAVLDDHTAIILWKNDWVDLWRFDATLKTFKGTHGPIGDPFGGSMVVDPKQLWLPPQGAFAITYSPGNKHTVVIITGESISRRNDRGDFQTYTFDREKDGSLSLSHSAGFESWRAGPDGQVVIDRWNDRADRNQPAPLHGHIEQTPQQQVPIPPQPFESETIVEISASSERGFVIGPVTTGTTIALQYVSGKWRAWGKNAAVNPDFAPPGTDGSFLVIAEGTGPSSPTKLLWVVPQGTVRKPFTFTIDHDAKEIILRIKGENGKFDGNPGAVSYRLTVTPPPKP